MALIDHCFFVCCQLYLKVSLTDMRSRLGLALVLATLDTTIVATALLSIASDLGQFDKASWIVVAYFLTYSGFLLVFARISDVFGKKPVLMFAVVMFFVWSIACACAQTILQL